MSDREQFTSTDNGLLVLAPAKLNLAVADSELAEMAGGLGGAGAFLIIAVLIIGVLFAKEYFFGSKNNKMVQSRNGLLLENCTS